MKNKTFIVLLILLSAGMSSVSQNPFIVLHEMMKITGVKDGEWFEWENNRPNIYLDSQTGNFSSFFSNADFVNALGDPVSVNDTVTVLQRYTLEGKFPILEIIDQQQLSHEYPLELQLLNDALGVSVTLLFTMNVTCPESADNVHFRIFDLQGVLYNDESHLPAFTGFENEIHIWLMFNSKMNFQN